MNSRSIVNYAMVGLLSVCVIPTLAQGGEDTGPSGQRLREIIAAYWTDLLKTHPLEATFFVGDQRFSDRLDDPSDEAYQHWLDRLEATQTALNTIDPKTLSADERLDRDVLRSTIQSRLQARRFGDHLVPRLPGDWPDADRQAIKARIKQAIEQDVAPAYARLADFVETVYLPACPDRVGLCATADGAAYYAFLVRDYTTTDLTPDQIHAIGLAEMARTRAAMESIRREVRFPHAPQRLDPRPGHRLHGAEHLSSPQRDRERG